MHYYREHKAGIYRRLKAGYQPRSTSACWGLGRSGPQELRHRKREHLATAPHSGKQSRECKTRQRISTPTASQRTQLLHTQIQTSTSHQQFSSTPCARSPRAHWTRDRTQPAQEASRWRVHLMCAATWCRALCLAFIPESTPAPPSIRPAPRVPPRPSAPPTSRGSLPDPLPMQADLRDSSMRNACLRQ